MCDFNNLTQQEKIDYHKQLLEYANKFGGKNFFLTLLEQIREVKPHPLLSGSHEFHTDLGSISWNKTIFKDKLQLLLKARQNESKQNNFLPKENEKSYKKILNVVRTIKPIVFHVKPEDKESGTGFFIQAFNIIDDDTTKLNPIFDALFFCSVATVKKVLNYEVRT